MRKAMIEQDAGFLREGVRGLSQALMMMEVEEHVRARRNERSPARTGQRSGYGERSWDRRVGSVELRVPRVRDSSYFPSLLEPRRRTERALSAVVQEDQRGGGIRLVGTVLLEQHDEWQVSKRYFGAGSLAKLEREEEVVFEQAALMAS